MIHRQRLLVTGDIVLRDHVLRDGFLLVEGDRVQGVSATAPTHELGTTILDCSGKYVVAGLVDSHVHAQSSSHEGIGRASRGAAVGGVTTMIDMPFDSSEPVRSGARLLAKGREVEAESIVDVGLYATIGMDGDLSEVDALVELGACGFKVSMQEGDPTRLPGFSLPLLYRMFDHLAPTGVPIIIHAENQELLDWFRREQVVTAIDAHGRSRPLVTETVAIAEALELALTTGARVHIAHVTHPHGFELIRAFSEMGAVVSGELCVHYLVLTDEDDVARLGPRAKVNPPLRDVAAREGLWAQLQSGCVATISSDHAPWPSPAKDRPMMEASPGVPGLETLVSVLVTESQTRGIDLAEILSYVTWRPARFFGLDRKGSLEAGRDADFCVLELGDSMTVDRSASYSVAQWSPFDGREVSARVVRTFVRGREIARDGKVTVEPGGGKWLRRAV
jgi:allantoinase